MKEKCIVVGLLISFVAVFTLMTTYKYPRNTYSMRLVTAGEWVKKHGVDIYKSKYFSYEQCTCCVKRVPSIDMEDAVSIAQIVWHRLDIVTKDSVTPYRVSLVGDSVWRVYGRYNDNRNDVYTEIRKVGCTVMRTVLVK